MFRGDHSELLAEPVPVNVLTAPAPNAGAVARNEPDRVADIAPVFAERALRVLGPAARHDQRHLVFGAWGCGVFRNDPAEVARMFAALLAGPASGVFESVSFAVLARNPADPALVAFARELT